MSPDEAAVEVTAVIPTHNRAGLVGRAVASSLGQLGVTVEALVVDDGSADDTQRVLAGLAEQDPRIRVIRHAEPEGVARARNDAIAQARGDWVAFLDDDDLWAPHKLRAQLDAAGAAAADWVWSAAIAVDGSLRPLRHIPAPDPQTIGRSILENCWIAAPSTVMVRTAVLRELGGFDERFGSAADWDLWVRLAQRPAAASQDVLLAYVEHENNMLAGASDPERARPEFERLRDKHGQTAAEQGIAFGHVWWTRWVASRERLAGRRWNAARVYLRGAVEHRSPGDLVRAAGALAGEARWRRARERLIGPAEPPAWLPDGR